MAVLQKYFTSANSSGIIIWESGTTDVGTSFWCVGNKSDGTAAYTLIDISALLASLPPGIVINSATLRMPAYNLSAWGSTALTAKVARITSAWNTSTNWSTKPTLDTGDAVSASIGAVPSSSNYDYRTGLTTKYLYRLYPEVKIVDEWGDVSGSSDTWLSSYGGASYYVYADSTHRTYYYFLGQTQSTYSTYIKYHTIDVTQIITELISSGYGLALYFDTPGPNSSRKYFKTSGATSQNQQWLLTIDYTALPAPTAPNLGTTGTITGSPHLFDWPDASDASGFFASAQMYYEFQFAPDGSTWGDTYATDAGVSQYSLNIKTLLSLAAGQYYYNTAAKIRVRTKTPPYEETNYYSAWSEAALTIDYRVPPTAPTLTPSKSSPYEGEEITLDLDRPTACNTHDATGDTNVLDYRVETDTGTLMASGTEPVTADDKTLNYTVGNLTTGKADFSTNIRARCIDTENQSGTYTATQAFTVKRFRAPILQIAKAERSETSAKVYILIADTGYGASQSNGQISKIQYDIGAGFVDAALGTWSGLTNTFTITGLSGTLSYNLSVRAVNKAPDSTALSDKTGNPATTTITEFRPAFAALKDNDTGIRMGYVRALIVGDDDEVEIGEGCAKIQGDVDVGGAILIGGEALSKAALGLGNVTNDAQVKKIASSIIGNLMAWGGTGGDTPEDTGLAHSAVPVAANNQLILSGWGYIAGNASSTLNPTVTFPDDGFDDIPVVIPAINYMCKATAGGVPAHAGDFPTTMSSWGYILAGPPTKTQVTLRLYRSAAWAANTYYGYSWIAIGMKAR